MKRHVVGSIGRADGQRGDRVEGSSHSRPVLKTCNEGCVISMVSFRAARGILGVLTLTYSPALAIPQAPGVARRLPRVSGQQSLTETGLYCIDMGRSC